jgi:hypothetical protein
MVLRLENRALCHTGAIDAENPSEALDFTSKLCVLTLEFLIDRSLRLGH